jgi:hypothetical protein
LQFAWDGAELRTGSEAGAVGISRFTSWLVDGLEKGQAAPEDEHITMDALYQYLFRRARSDGATATPQRFVQGGVGDVVISANPLMGASQIDPGILAALTAEEFRTRLGAVAELTLQMDEVHTVAARAARRLLQRHLQRERDFQVRRAITRALEEGSNHPSEAARLAEEERQRAEAARQAEEEQRRAEAARQAEEERRRAEAARQAEKEQRQDDARKRNQKEKMAYKGRSAIAISVIGAFILASIVMLKLVQKDPFATSNQTVPESSQSTRDREAAIPSQSQLGSVPTAPEGYYYDSVGQLQRRPLATSNYTTPPSPQSARGREVTSPSRPQLRPVPTASYGQKLVTA